MREEVGNKDAPLLLTRGTISKGLKAAFRIHLILTWIRIQILGSTFGKSGSGSSDPPFRNSGDGSSDPHLEKVDPDPVPKWIRIRIRVPIFHKEIHVGQIKMLIFITAKI